MNTPPPTIKARAKKEVILISSYLLFVAGFSLYAMLAPSTQTTPSITLETLFLNVIGTVVIFSPILYIGWRSSAEATLMPLVKRNIQPKALLGIAALAIVLPVALFPVETLVGQLLTYLPDNIASAAQAINERSNAIYIVPKLDHSILEIISLYIALAAMPAIIEEFIFRGILQHRMHASGLKPAWAIGLSSLIFCIMHLQLINLLPMMILSSILGWLYYRGQSLHYSVVFHALNNALSITVLIVIGDPSYTADSEPMFWVVSVGAIFTACMLLKFLHQTLGSEGISRSNQAR